MKICIICNIQNTCRWWSGPRCNICALTQKRRSLGIKPKNPNFNKKRYKAEWHLKNYIPKEKKERIYKEPYHLSEKGKRKKIQWTKENQNSVILSRKKYREKNRAEINQKARIKKKNNKGLVNYYTNLRRKRTKLQTPKWVDKKKLKEIYINCPEGYDVDHIIPINNKNICGLHIPYNLQYLPRKINQQKSNKLNFSYLNNEMENHNLSLNKKDGKGD